VLLILASLLLRIIGPEPSSAEWLPGVICFEDPRPACIRYSLEPSTVRTAGRLAAVDARCIVVADRPEVNEVLFWVEAGC